MLLIEKINMVLDGQLKQTAWTVKRNKWETNTVFFEKTRITLKKYFLSERRDGRAYVKTTHKYIINLTPMLRIRGFSGKKNGEHSGVTEFSYRGNWISANFNSSEISDTGMLGVKHMLKHYGYTPDIYRAIVPWGKAVNPDETYKRLWRSDDVREIFKGLGIQPKKSLSRMLLNIIHDEDTQVLPLLASIKFLWDICKDENIVAEVWPTMWKNFPMLWELDKEEKAAFRSMLKGWPKHTRISFGRSIAKLKRWEYDIWQDVLTMITNIHNDLGVVQVRGRNIVNLHNNLLGESNKVAEKKASADIKYEIDFINLHKFEFSNKKGAYMFLLPKRTHDLLTWGKHLQNCMGSYIERVSKRNTTIVGVIDRAHGDELIVGLELNHRKVSQMSMKGNAQVENILKLAILTALMDAGAIDNIHPKPINQNKWYRMTKAERKFYDNQYWLPNIQPIVEIGVFPGPDRNANNDNIIAVDAF